MKKLIGALMKTLTVKKKETKKLKKLISKIFQKLQKLALKVLKMNIETLGLKMLFSAYKNLSNYKIILRFLIFDFSKKRLVDI
jgi:uncharacterized membrane protein